MNTCRPPLFLCDIQSAEICFFNCVGWKQWVLVWPINHRNIDPVSKMPTIYSKIRFFPDLAKQDRGTKIQLGGYILRCSFNVLRRAYNAQLGLESANFSSQTIFVTHRGVQFTVYSTVCGQTDKPDQKWWFFVTHRYTPHHWDCLRKCLFFVPNIQFS